MDIYAYSQIENFHDYLNKYYGEPPRLRGVCFMRLEEPYDPSDDDLDTEIFNKYCGQDVIYVHTRCGGDSNYIAFGCDNWESRNKDFLLEAFNDEYDSTYRNHYLKAVINDEYAALIDKYKKENNNE